MTERLVKEKEDLVLEVEAKYSKVEMENMQLREEVGIYKGRCTNLARDVELHFNEMNKLHHDSNHSVKQVQILQDRVKNME